MMPGFLNVRAKDTNAHSATHKATLKGAAKNDTLTGSGRKFLEALAAAGMLTDSGRKIIEAGIQKLNGTPPTLQKSATEAGLTCVICADIFFLPVSVACGHTFCKPCFTRHLEAQPFVCDTAPCPQGCGAQVPFTVPAVAVSLKEQVTTNFQERLDAKVATMPHDDKDVHVLEQRASALREQRVDRSHKNVSISSVQSRLLYVFLCMLLCGISYLAGTTSSSPHNVESNVTWVPESQDAIRNLDTSYWLQKNPLLVRSFTQSSPGTLLTLRTGWFTYLLPQDAPNDVIHGALKVERRIQAMDSATFWTSVAFWGVGMWENTSAIFVSPGAASASVLLDVTMKVNALFCFRKAMLQAFNARAVGFHLWQRYFEIVFYFACILFGEVMGSAFLILSLSFFPFLTSVVWGFLNLFEVPNLISMLVDRRGETLLVLFELCIRVTYSIFQVVWSPGIHLQLVFQLTYTAAIYWAVLASKGSLYYDKWVMWTLARDPSVHVLIAAMCGISVDSQFVTFLVLLDTIL